jgi:hypothetical protein
VVQQAERPLGGEARDDEDAEDLVRRLEGLGLAGCVSIGETEWRGRPTRL